MKRSVIYGCARPPLRNYLLTPDAPTPGDAPPADPGAVAPPAETPPADPPAETPPADDGGVSKTLLDIIHSTLKPADEPVVEAAPEPPAPAPQPPAEPPVATPPTAEPPKGVKTKLAPIARGHAIVDGIPPAPPAPAVNEPPAAPPAPTGLTEEQQEELAEAEQAARMFPDRYKNFPQQLREWNEGFKARAQALLTQNPNLTEDSDEYQRLLQSKPALRQIDQRKILRQVAEESAIKKAEEKLAPRLNKIEMDARRASVLPQVQQFSRQTFGKGIQDLIIADEKSPLRDAVKLFREKGVEAVKADFPLEFGVAAETITAHMQMVDELLLMKNGATEFDQRNQVHAALSGFIDRECREVLSGNPRNLVNAGRQFLSRGDFIAMLNREPNEAETFDRNNWSTKRYWTLNDQVIIDTMARRAKEMAEKTLAAEEKRATDRGFVRAPKKAVENPQPNPPKTPTEIKPPRAQPASAPGAISPPKNQPAKDDSPIPVSGIVQSLRIKK